MDVVTESQRTADFGSVRRELVRLCAAGAYVDAFLALEEATLAQGEATGLWEYLERQMVQSGETTLAEAVRTRLAAAGSYTAQMAIADAQSAIDLGEPAQAELILRSSFDLDDLPPMAAKLMGQAMALGARSEALEHFAASGETDPDAALAEIDILRDSDRLKEAEERCRRYIGLHAGDHRFHVRSARIAAALMKWDEALQTWEHLVERPGFPRSVAMANRIQVLNRLGHSEETEALFAEFLLQEPELPIVVQTAFAIGLVNLADAILARAEEHHGITPLSERDWDAICQTLLQSGQIGQVAWLANRGLPVGPSADQALTAAKRLSIRSLESVATQEEGRRLTSPEHLLPFPPYIRMRRPSPRQSLDDARILMVNASLVSGGAERQFVFLVKALLEQGVPPDRIDLAFFSLAKDRGRAHFLPMLEESGVRVHDLQALSGQYDQMERDLDDRCQLLPRPLRGDVAALHHIIRQVQPTVLHGWQDRAALACGFAGAHLGVERIVMSARNMQPQRREPGNRLDGKALFTALTLLPNVVLTANCVAGVGDYETWLGLPSDTVRLLNNGLDLKPLRGNNRPARPADRDDPIRVTGVFRLAQNKRPLLWLETIARLRELSSRRIVPRIVGVGPLAQDVLAHAQNLGLDDLRIEGDLVSEHAIYSDADVVLLMSRVEGTPNVLLEAQALGIAVAACDVGGVRHAMLNRGDAAGLVLPADVSAIEAAARIDGWLPGALNADPSARRAFVRDHYSLETLGRNALDLYRIEQQVRD